MRRRPGVMTAPTTAAFATGEGPGVMAAPTTAAFATGDGPGVTRGGDHGCLRHRGADDADASHSCCSEHLSLLSVSALRRLRSTAMMAWIGMRPLAIS